MNRSGIAEQIDERQEGTRLGVVAVNLVRKLVSSALVNSANNGTRALGFILATAGP